jgi:hypothetical protein
VAVLQISVTSAQNFWRGNLKLKHSHQIELIRGMREFPEMLTDRLGICDLRSFCKRSLKRQFGAHLQILNFLVVVLLPTARAHDSAPDWLFVSRPSPVNH